MYYISGARMPGEVRAFRDMNIPVGVSMDSYTDALDAELKRNPHIRLFVDSGAFSEVDFDDDGNRSIRAPLTGEKWIEILNTYSSLSEVFGKRVIFVAPDCVGDQAESFCRLSRYRARVMDLMNESNVIVPLQRGDLTLSESYDKVVSILDDRIVVGIPFKKAATDLEDYITFALARTPPRVHFLGLGKVNAEWPKVMRFHQFLEDQAPIFSHDSCRIRSLTGNDLGTRPLTRAMQKRFPYGEGGRDCAMHEALLGLKKDLLKEKFFAPNQMSIVFGTKD